MGMIIQPINFLVGPNVLSLFLCLDGCNVPENKCQVLDVIVTLLHVKGQNILDFL